MDDLRAIIDHVETNGPCILQLSVCCVCNQVMWEDGTPHVREIARKVGVGPSTVTKHLNHTPVTPQTKPDPKTVEAYTKTIFDETQKEIAPRLVRGFRNVAIRWDKITADMESDARDVRHIAQAVDVNAKTISLLSGGVTSRSQQNQTSEHTHNVRVFQVPEKDTAAFQTQDGAKVQIEESYEVE